MNLFKAIKLYFIYKFTSKEIYLTWNEWEIFKNKYTFIYKKIIEDGLNMDDIFWCNN